MPARDRLPEDVRKRLSPDQKVTFDLGDEYGEPEINITSPTHRGYDQGEGPTRFGKSKGGIRIVYHD